MFAIAMLMSFHFSLFHRAANATPPPTCGITTVSYRFEGEPGTEFSYSGVEYVVPASGWVELLAKRGRANLAVAQDGHELLLDIWPQDEFGTRHVPLPKQKQGGTN